MRNIIGLGPHLRFVIRDNQRILQQVQKVEESWDGESRVMTFLEWADVPLVVEEVISATPPEKTKEPNKES